MGTLAGQDANDVEFVLAAPRSAQDSESLGIGATLSNCSAFGEHTMWLLDFDCCARLGLPMTAEDISKAVRSFWRNDPYYPRPGGQLWEIFRSRYLDTSRRILQDESADECVWQLPVMLMDEIAKSGGCGHGEWRG